MNTEPVKTTIKGIESTVTGAATVVTATAALLQAVFFFINTLPGWLGVDLNPADPALATIPDAVAQGVVTLFTVGAAWYVALRSKASIREAGDQLREEVTPWDGETGARTPGPLDFVVDNSSPDAPAG